MNQKAKPSVGIVGAGLAGISAACALADGGHVVTLFERRPFIGGRASSYEHPGTGEVVDNCQHVLLGCCTNLLDLYRRIGGEQKIRWYDRLTFLEPGGRSSEISPSFLPAPFHTALSFLNAKSLSFGDKLGIARAMSAMVASLPPDSSEDFLSWLRRHGQTQRAIDRFWKVVLVSALNEDLDRTSVHYAAQVFRESFLKSAEAGRMGVPTVPLTELYNAGADYIRARGGEVLLRCPVGSVAAQGGSVVITAGGESERRPHRFDCAILAVPYYQLEKLIAPEAAAEPSPPAAALLENDSSETENALLEKVRRFESSPITGIHLWFDRRITSLDHAVLLDRTIQWMFHKSQLLDRHRRPAPTTEKGAAGADAAAGAVIGGSYVELVVSASKSLVNMQRQPIIDLALKELAEFFPEVKNARLLKAAVIKEVHATFSVQPLSDAYRPPAATAWPRIFLAGDWTATSWPATMEGAVRSGYLAAEAASRFSGEGQRFLQPDLPAKGFMRLFRK